MKFEMIFPLKDFVVGESWGCLETKPVFGSLYSLCILVKEKAGRRSGLAKIKD
jgi:hypothetical protein